MNLSPGTLGATAMAQAWFKIQPIYKYFSHFAIVIQPLLSDPNEGVRICWIIERLYNRKADITGLIGTRSDNLKYRE